MVFLQLRLGEHFLEIMVDSRYRTLATEHLKYEYLN